MMMTANLGITVTCLLWVLTLNARMKVAVSMGDNDFALAFLWSKSWSVGRIYVANPGAVTASVSITTPRLSPADGGLNGSISVPPGGSAYFELDSVYFLAGSGVENTTLAASVPRKGLHVTSDEGVVVQSLSGSSRYNDGFRVSPVTKLGKVYMAVTHKYLGSSKRQGPYEIGIVAVHDDTRINVELHGPQPLSLTFNGVNYSSGDVIRFTLDGFQTAQFQCDYDDGGDLSGTIIIADQPIFVTSGAAQSSVGALLGRETIVSVMPPVEQLGRKYVIQPTVGRTTGDVLQVVGVCRDTTYSISEANGKSIGLVDRPLSRSQMGIHNLRSGVSHVLEASCPVLVAQLAMSRQGETHENTDPFLLVLPSVDNPLSASYAFTTMTSTASEFTNTLAVVVPTAVRDEVELDGTPINPIWTETRDQSKTQVTVTLGAHTIRHSANVRFSAWLYGQRQGTSYALELSPSPDSCTLIPWATSIDDVGKDEMTCIRERTYILSAADRAVSDPAARRTCLSGRSRIECAAECSKGAAWCRGFEYCRTTAHCCLLDAVGGMTSHQSGTSMWITD